MLGKTAGGVYWMSRYLERSENTARMIEAGLRISLTRSDASQGEWTSIIRSTGLMEPFLAIHGDVNGASVVDFLLREPLNPGSVVNAIENARNNARLVRTALTREVWEAVNECYIVLSDILADPIRARDLPQILQTIRQRSAYVRGAFYGTMLRNDIYDFSSVGSFFERADSVARLLDVKYFILLPSVSDVGGPSDNVQWETILRATSSHRAFQTIHSGELDSRNIADFLLLDRRFPRSLAFCYSSIVSHMTYLTEQYDASVPSLDMAQRIHARLVSMEIDQVFEFGLHEFITMFLQETADMALQFESDYRFLE